MAATAPSNSEAWSPTTLQIMESMKCSGCGIIPMLPVYVCEAKGHPYCYRCTQKKPRCTKKIKESGGTKEVTCGGEIHPHRCKLVEAIFLKSEFPCNNAAKGCKALVTGREFVEHQDVCPFKTYECPFQMKCPELIFRDEFISHVHFIHGIPLVVVNPDGLLQMKLNCPTYDEDSDSVMWIERIVEVHQYLKTRLIYLFINCKYVFGENKLIIWFTQFEDIRDVKVKLSFAITTDQGEVLRKINGMVVPYFSAPGMPTNENHLFTIPNAFDLIRGRENNIDQWFVSLKFYLVALQCALVPIPPST